ncbi:MAG: DUF5684 domain-containing protein [Lachnospiraceae bacterium]|nr:DUF5684 domain-containing protein [Lachnospiraceae bacterium]
MEDGMSKLVELMSSGTASTISLAISILYIIAEWKILSKAGEPGWKALIPIYNIYMQYKISWKGSVFWGILGLIVLEGILTGIGGIGLALSGIIGIALFIISIMSLYYLSKSFGHGVGFTLGLLLLSPIFILILGLGSSRYVGNGSQM